MSTNEAVLTLDQVDTINRAKGKANALSNLLMMAAQSDEEIEPDALAELSEMALGIAEALGEIDV